MKFQLKVPIVAGIKYQQSILKATEYKQENSQFLDTQSIIAIPPGCWLNAIAFRWLPSFTINELAAYQLKELKSGDFFVVYWLGKFIQIDKKYCDIPSHIGWSSNY